MPSKLVALDNARHIGERLGTVLQDVLTAPKCVALVARVAPLQGVGGTPSPPVRVISFRNPLATPTLSAIALPAISNSPSNPKETLNDQNL